MDAEKAIALAREIFSDEPSVAGGVRWWLFEHGTIVLSVLRSSEEQQAVSEMRWLADCLGPYEGQGSVYGDVNPMSLKMHQRTWLVSYPFTTAIMTLVDSDDFDKRGYRPPSDEVVQAAGVPVRAQEAVGDLRAGLCARMKRNLDARERVIIARSDDGPT